MIHYKDKEILPKQLTVVLHNTAVSRAKQPLQRTSVNNYHKSKWNFPSELNGSFIGYNFFCESTGKRTQERYYGEETIAQIGNNCDSLSRCSMVSYCMSGYFEVEKPTEYQVTDFVEFVEELKSDGFRVTVKQHKDVYPNRTCAELSDSEVQSWFKKETKDVVIAKLKAQNKQLIGMVTLLISLLRK